MGERFGSDGVAGDTSFTDGGEITDPAEERFGGEGDGGVQWSAETFFLNSLSDVDIPAPPTDGWVLTYDSVSEKWIASAPSGGSDVEFEPETISLDIDFAGVASVDVQIPLGNEVRILLMGRLYIDTDPGSAFNEWATYTFYNKSTKKGADAYYRSVVKISYTELEVGTSGIDAEFTPDDHTIFSECNLVKFLDNGEYARVETVADTIGTEDVVGVHGVDTGVSRVSEFSGFDLFNDESATTGYLRIEFPSVQTVSLKMDLILVK